MLPVPLRIESTSILIILKVLEICSAGLIMFLTTFIAVLYAQVCNILFHSLYYFLSKILH